MIIFNNKGETSSRLNEPISDSQDISTNPDFQKIAVEQENGSHYFVNCEHCSLEEIRSDRYIYHCSKFHAEIFKDTKVECDVCGEFVHHVLTNHHAKLFHGGVKSLNQSSKTSEGSKRWSFRLFFLEVSPERGSKTSKSKSMKCLLCKSGKLLHADSCKRHFKTYHVSNEKYRQS